MSKERFKITVKDRKTGQVDKYYVHELGYQMSGKTNERGAVVRKIVMDYPRIKTKNGKS